MECQRCKSQRILKVMAKAADSQHHELNGVEYNGGISVPDLCEGDYLRFKMCLTCGQLQGSFPIPPIHMEYMETGEGK